MRSGRPFPAGNARKGSWCLLRCRNWVAPPTSEHATIYWKEGLPYYSRGAEDEDAIAVMYPMGGSCDVVGSYELGAG